MERVMTNDVHMLKQKAIYYMEKKLQLSAGRARA